MASSIGRRVPDGAHAPHVRCPRGRGRAQGANAPETGRDPDLSSRLPPTDDLRPPPKTECRPKSRRLGIPCREAQNRGATAQNGLNLRLSAKPPRAGRREETEPTWWAKRDSNPRPSGCKPDALTNGAIRPRSGPRYRNDAAGHTKRFGPDQEGVVAAGVSGPQRPQQANLTAWTQTAHTK